MALVISLLFALNPLSLVKSQGVLIFFFSPTCPYCVQQAPLLEEMYEDGFRVVGISEINDTSLIDRFRKITHVKFTLIPNRGEIEKAGVFSFPVIGIYFPNPRNPELLLISSGLIKSKKELISRISYAVKEKFQNP